MANNSKSSGGTGGIGFVGALQIAFIVLKLMNKITWSWLWVLSPTWITVILVVVCVAIYVKLMR